MNYFQTYQKATVAERIELFEAVIEYLVSAPEFDKMGVKQIEVWNASAPYGLMNWSAKRWIRETKEAYIQRITAHIDEQYQYVLKMS